MTEVFPKKTLLITGGSSGLGYQCAHYLLDKGDCYVIITSTDLQRAQNSARKLSNTTGKKWVLGLQLHLQSQKAIREFASNLSSHPAPPLKGAIFNAGVQLQQLGARTAEGIEFTFGVNHLGHFLLANLLIRQLERPARLIFISSGLHDPRHPSRRDGICYNNAKALAFPAKKDSKNDRRNNRLALTAYALSKLCNLLCAFEMDRRLQLQDSSTPDKAITVNVFDPGLMPGTALARNYGPVFRWFWHWVLPLFSPILPGANSVRSSARHLTNLISAQTSSHHSGKYFVGDKMKQSSEESCDYKKAKELWETSRILTGLTRLESPL